jgi:hypothetical protein
LFLEYLLEDVYEGYCQAKINEKRTFVQKHVLDRIAATGRILYVFIGNHPLDGHLEIPSEDYAFRRLAQKLRDKKKQRLHHLLGVDNDTHTESAGVVASGRAASPSEGSQQSIQTIASSLLPVIPTNGTSVQFCNADSLCVKWLRVLCLFILLWP